MTEDLRLYKEIYELNKAIELLQTNNVKKHAAGQDLLKVANDLRDELAGLKHELFRWETGQMGGTIGELIKKVGLRFRSIELDDNNKFVAKALSENHRAGHSGMGNTPVEALKELIRVMEVAEGA